MDLPIFSNWWRLASVVLVLCLCVSSPVSNADSFRMLGYLEVPSGEGEEEQIPRYYFPTLAAWQDEYLRGMKQRHGSLTYTARLADIVVQFTIKPAPAGVIIESNRLDVVNHVEYRPAPLLIECLDCHQPVKGDQLVRESETDYVSPRFTFVRAYTSDQAASPLGPGWRSSYHRGVRFDPSGTSAMVHLADGGELRLSQQDKDRYITNDGSQLVRDGTGWKLKFARGGSERFNANNQLIETTVPGGYTQQLDYQGNLVTAVRDSYGAAFRFEYRNNLLARAITPTGATFDYTMDAKGNLAGVMRADGSKRAYAYGQEISSLLTSIDDDDLRFRTFAYDAQGRATSSALGDGTSSTQVQWVYPVEEGSGPPGSRPIPSELKLIDGNVTWRTVYELYASRDSYELVPILAPVGSGQPGEHPTVVFGEAVLRPTELHKICPAASCPGLFERRSYDDYGHLTGIESLADTGSLAQAIAVQGTDPTRPELPLKVTQAFGTPQAVATAYSWHPQFALPTGINRPGQAEALSYNADGLLTGRTLTDSVTGIKTEWQYAYGAWGKLSSMRNPAGRATYYSYDAKGNLATETDSVGYVTRYSDYDAEGRLGKVVRPDGVTIMFGYDQRGRQNLRNEGGLITRTAYTADGQIARLATPEGRVLTYAYDSAHRLRSVDDNVGGRIEYQRDGQGRIVRELLKDNATASVWAEVQQ